MESQPTILIADDDAAIVRLLEHFLAPLNARILNAPDGETALRLAREETPDVVLLDVMMPGPSGWEICQTLKGVHRTSGIMIILMTAKGDVRDRLTGLQVGADDYLVKPLQKNDVTWRVTRLLDLAARRREDEVGIPSGRPPEPASRSGHGTPHGIPRSGTVA